MKDLTNLSHLSPTRLHLSSTFKALHSLTQLLFHTDFSLNMPHASFSWLVLVVFLYPGITYFFPLITPQLTSIGTDLIHPEGPTQMPSLLLNLPDPLQPELTTSLSILPQHFVFSSGLALIPFCIHLLQYSTHPQNQVQKPQHGIQGLTQKTVITRVFLSLPLSCGLRIQASFFISHQSILQNVNSSDTAGVS